ncbi:hypothetical protein [Paracoccus cavernae]
MGQVAKLSKMRVIDYEVTKGNDGSEPDAPAKVESKPDGPPPAGADSEPEKVELTEQQVAIAEAVEETAEVATTVQRTTASSPSTPSKTLGQKSMDFRAIIAATRPSDDEIRKQFEEFDAAVAG